MAKSKDERVKEAEQAQKDGKPLPSGVSYNAYRVPPIMPIEDDPEWGGSGEVAPVAGAATVEPQTSGTAKTSEG